MLKHVIARIKPAAGESTSQARYDPIISPSDEIQPRRRSRSGHSRRNSTLSVHGLEDPGIKWAHYILGAASLLPWNGELRGFLIHTFILVHVVDIGISRPQL